MKNVILAAVSLLASCASTAYAADLGMTAKGSIGVTIQHSDGSSTNLESFSNIITNQGLDVMLGHTVSGGYNAPFAGVMVSTDNIPPSPTDTGLPSVMAFKVYDYPQSSQAVSVEPPYTMRHITKTTFPLGAVVGNVCKIATFMGGGTLNASAPISTSALVKVAGVPTCITVLASDQLVITYEYDFVVPNDVTGESSIIVDGMPSTFTWTARPFNIRTVANAGASDMDARLGRFGFGGRNAGGMAAAKYRSNTTLCPVDSNYCSGGVDYYDSFSCVPYVVGSYALTCTFKINTGTARTIGGWERNAGPLSWTFVYGQTYIKTADQTFEQTVTLSLSDGS